MGSELLLKHDFSQERTLPRWTPVGSPTTHSASPAVQCPALASLHAQRRGLIRLTHHHRPRGASDSGRGGLTGTEFTFLPETTAKTNETHNTVH